MLPLSQIFGLKKIRRSVGIQRHLGTELHWNVNLLNQIGIFISVGSGEHLVCFIVIVISQLFIFTIYLFFKIVWSFSCTTTLSCWRIWFQLSFPPQIKLIHMDIYNQKFNFEWQGIEEIEMQL